MPSVRAARAVVLMKLHLLPSITLLLPPHDTADEMQVVADWARGLDWVKWLLGSVRARTEVLMVDDGLPVADAWSGFADGLLRQIKGPALKSAWQAAYAGDLAKLIAADEALSAQLNAAQARRSVKAGEILLKSTRHARYQAVLGRLREAVEQGRCSGHFAVVWAAVGHFFQLSLANVVAEYLHLEWDVVSRSVPACDKPHGSHSIANLTRQIMREVTEEASLRVVEA